MAEKKNILIFTLKFEDYLILLVLALGVTSTFFSNKDNIPAALAFLLAATLMYFIASTYARRRGGGKAVGFTRSLNGFVSGLVFLVAPCIFMYHWKYNSAFQSAILLIFMLSGVFRIAAFDHFGTQEDAHKYYYVGMPVFWSPIIALAAFIAALYLPGPAVHAALSVVMLIFSALMLINVEFKFLHKPIEWVKKKI